MARTLHVAFSTNGAGNSPMSLGIELGIFAAHGVDLAMDRPMPRGGDVMRALESGEADIGTGSGLPILKMAARGAQPVIFMSIENENVFAIMGARGIGGPDDLRGTTVGIAGPEDQDGIMMRRALSDWGLDPASDVELRPFAGGRGEVWRALERGDVTAMACTIPEPLNARAVGLPILRDFMDSHEPYQSGSVVTTRRLADAEPDLITRVVRAQVEAIHAFRADFERALPHLRRCTEITDVDVLRQTHQLFGDAMLNYVPEEAPLRAVLADVERFAGERLDVDVAAIVEPSFALEVQREQESPPTGARTDGVGG